jgi:DNA repair exonuclease SbcCD ATPase subunit
VKLSRIRIEQFRRFRQPFEIRDLEPGLNLFTGPNEAGKSTIVAAIRAAFFERHRSGSVDDLRPWGDSSASPTVELEFAANGQHYRLIKSFLGKKRCELHFGTRHLDSADAEDHLAELLGFRYAGRGASCAEHWGLPGLLWIPQGEAQVLHKPVEHAAEHLRLALNESLGEVAGGAGDSVLKTVEALRNELLTPAAGKPKGAYAEAIDREAVLAAEVAGLDADIAAYRQKVDAVAKLRGEQEHDAATQPWRGFREQEQDAARALAALRQVEQQLAAERQQAVQVEARIDLLRSQLETFAKEEKDTEARAAAVATVREKQAAAATLVAEWQARHGEAERRDAEARDTLRLARQEHARLSLARDLAEARQKAESGAAVLAKAEAEQARCLELRRLAAATETTPQDLETLRGFHQQLRELRIRQNASATGLRFNLEPGRAIHIGAETVAGAGERQLLETTTLILPGLGSLDIAPGGADLAQLRRQEAELADRQTDLLQRLGLASLEAAETRARAHVQHLAESRTAEATLNALAPRGVDTLRSELAAQQAAAERHEAALLQLPPAAADAAPLPTVVDAESAEETARTSLAASAASLQQAQLDESRAHTALETAKRELDSALALLSAPERAERLATANRGLVDARAELAAMEARIEAQARQLAAARPDILQQDVARLRQCAELAEKGFNDRRDALLRLEVELQAAGAQGLEERRAEKAGELARARRRVGELRRRAEALDRLLSLLRDKRRALTRRLQAPLQKHLSGYLQLLFPDASLEIDENLAPGPLTRQSAAGPESGDFEALSFGAREQMGIISRLAYAGLLREAGRPTLLILDDALVHSDEERLAQMKRVLFDAATRHQILLFTCHPAHWRDLGVRARSLEAIRAEA